MSKINVRKVEGNTVYKAYKVVPYPLIEELLREDGQAFVEGIGRKTAWAACKILSNRLGFSVKAEKRLLLLEEEKTVDKYLEGYLFFREKRSSS
jgi:hypothetical protein